MSKELVEHVNKYITDVISGFESGMYKMICQTNPTKISFLAKKDQPFITIFRDLHQSYYTSTFNSIVNKNDKYVTETFNKFHALSGHSKQCILNVLANLIISIHFQFNRKNLNHKSYDLYMVSIKKEINSLLSTINIQKLFDHICTGATDDKLVELAEGINFIEIEMSHQSNGVTKKINSFTDKNGVDK